MPLSELKRLQSINRLLKLEINKDSELQRITDLAGQICEVQAAQLTLSEENLRFDNGFDAAFLASYNAIHEIVDIRNNPVVIPDVLLNDRLARNLLIGHNHQIRFFACFPLLTTDSYCLGYLSIFAIEPKILEPNQLKMLETLCRQAIQLVEFEQSIGILKEQFISARQAEIEMRSFFESSVDTHLLLGLHFEVLAFNKSLETLIRRQYGLQILRGEQMSRYLNKELLPSFYEHYLRALSGESSFEQRVIHYAKEDIWWMIKYEPAFDPHNEIIGVTVNSTDITNGILQEQRVILQNQSLVEIAALQSHEFRKPVASIIGLLSLLKNEGYTDKIEELKLLEKVIAELDEKIHMVVAYTERGLGKG